MSCDTCLVTCHVSRHRNNIDHSEQPWAGEVPQPVPPVDDGKQGFWCPVPGEGGSNNKLSGEHSVCL